MNTILTLKQLLAQKYNKENIYFVNNYKQSNAYPYIVNCENNCNDPWIDGLTKLYNKLSI